MLFKLKKSLINLSKKNIIMRKILRGTLYVKNLVIYKITTLFTIVDDKTIIFGCFNGRNYSDSPKAIYKYMLNNEKYKDYKFIWAFSDTEKHKFMEKNKNTYVVKSKGIEYYRALGKSKYWFFNYKIYDFIYPKKRQIFTQCWHGTPLKRLGCDLQHFDNAMNTLEDMKKRYKKETQKFSYFLSPSEFCTEKFRSIWNMNEVGKEDCILELGYPRNDFLYNYTEDDLKEIKRRLGISDINKKIILYAPTYRDNQHTSGIGYTYKTEVDFDKLKEELSDDYIILFRAHWLVANKFDFERYTGFIYDASNYDDINELYIISDLLITDYSSVFFDYANLKRPIIFYMYDLEAYRDDIRGFYLDIDKELPGPIVREEIGLIDEIKKIINSNDYYNEKYMKFNQKFNYLDDGKAAERVVKKIII